MDQYRMGARETDNDSGWWSCRWGQPQSTSLSIRTLVGISDMGGKLEGKTVTRSTTDRHVLISSNYAGQDWEE